VTRDHEGGSELVEEGLLGSIGEAIVIGVCLLSTRTDRTDSAEDEEEYPDSSHVWLDAFSPRERESLKSSSRRVWRIQSVEVPDVADSCSLIVLNHDDEEVFDMGRSLQRQVPWIEVGLRDAGSKILRRIAR
jgi:hypothetical protein